MIDQHRLDSAAKALARAQAYRWYANRLRSLVSIFSSGPAVQDIFDRVRLAEVEAARWEDAAWLWMEGSDKAAVL